MNACRTDRSSSSSRRVGVSQPAYDCWRSAGAGSAPADRWPQFRGTPAAGRHDAAPRCRATLKLLWTYEAGDAIESSAAIVDGVVYVGSQTGELHAVNLADGKVKWKYKASADGIGESSPAVADGTRLRRRSLRRRARRRRRDAARRHGRSRPAARSSRRRSSPATSVLIGSYDSNLYALGAKDGKLAWKVQTEGYVHATPAVVDGIAYIAGCDEILRGIRISDGKEVFTMSSGAYTGASPADCRRARLLRHLRKRSAGRRSEDAQDRVALQAPRAELPVLLVGGRARRSRDRRRPRQDGARDRSQDRQGGLDVHDPRARRLVAGRRRRNRVYIGSNDGKLYVLDAATGKSVFEFEAGGPLSASPAVADGRLVIGSQDGKLFCLG